MLKQAHGVLEVRSQKRGMYEVTSQVKAWVDKQGIRDGLLTLFIPHTSASLLIQENADPAVVLDLERFFSRLVKDGDPLFSHDAEGPDDMPAHVRSALTQTHLGIPVNGGSPALGTWQGIFLFEHRSAPHTRCVRLHLFGE